MGIFARVLHDVLAAHHDSDLSHLGGQSARTDPVWYPLRRLAIPPEVIARLKDAATSDEKRATLNPDDLEYVSRELRFTDEERARLRAALLAQGVEMFLRDRMTPPEAHTAVEVANVVFTRLLQQFESIYERVRAPDSSTVMGSEEMVAVALNLADHAGIMLQAMAQARERHAQFEERFWRRVAATAYQEIIQLVRPIEPELADDLNRVLARLSGD